MEGGGRDNIVNNAVSAIIQVLAAAAQLHTPVTFDSILSETLCVSLSQFDSEQKYSHTFKYIYSQTTRQFTIEFTVRPNNFKYMKERECVFTCSPDCSG